MHAIKVFAHLWSEDQLCRCRGQDGCKKSSCLEKAHYVECRSWSQADSWRFFLKTNVKSPGMNSSGQPFTWQRRTMMSMAFARLLEWGADVNICDHKKRTPIHLAAMGGHTQVDLRGKTGGIGFREIWSWLRCQSSVSSGPQIINRFSKKHRYVLGLVV